MQQKFYQQKLTFLMFFSSFQSYKMQSLLIMIIVQRNQQLLSTNYLQSDIYILIIQTFQMNQPTQTLISQPAQVKNPQPKANSDLSQQANSFINQQNQKALNIQTINMPIADKAKQYATINDDTVNAPINSKIKFHIQLIFVSIFHAASYYIVFDGKSNLESNLELDPELNTESSWTNWLIFIVINLLCVFISYFMNNIKTRLDNVKNIQNLKEDYQKRRNSSVSLVFSIECYHNQRKTGSKGTQKVVTHRASKVIQLSQCYDLSGFILPEVQKSFKKPYVFINFSANYSFIDEKQNTVLQNMYDQFVLENKRDSNQDHKKQFKFNDMEATTDQAYFKNSEAPNLKSLLAISSLFFLIWPVSMLLEIYYIERYKINIVKKIKLKENQIGYTKVE